MKFRAAFSVVGLLIVGLALGGQSLAVHAGSFGSGKPAHRAHHRHSVHLPVKLHAQVGLYNEYRAGALVPIRVTARNRTNTIQSGMVEVLDQSTGLYGGWSSDQASYESALTLPGLASKSITLYVPSTAISNGTVPVRLVSASNRLLGSDTPYVTSFSSSAVTVGALTSNAATTTWIRSAQFGHGRWVTTVPLSPSTFDASALALANFDVIVITDATVAQLDSAQLSALVQYVENGGGLLEIGGPGWQQDLRSLPPVLVPGRVTGVKVVTGLQSLSSLGPGIGSGALAGRTVVSVLTQPRGDVLASQHNVPLVVSDAVGVGRVVYLAFDPTLNPIAGSKSGQRVMARALETAAVATLNRAYTDSNCYGCTGSFAPELDNVPSPALAWVIGFLVLAALFILLLGPFNFWLLGKVRRRELLWMSVPIGAILCTGAAFGLAHAVRDQSVLVNSVGMVTLNGADSNPASFYLGTFAPIPGNYRLTLGQPGYLQSVPANQFGGIRLGLFPVRSCFGIGNCAASLGPAEVDLQEGAQPTVDFPHMDSWAMRNAEVSTSVNTGGVIHSDLNVGANGQISGWVENGTSLNLVHPALVAGKQWVHLPDMPPGTRVDVSIEPRISGHGYKYESIWQSQLGVIRWNFGPFDRAMVAYHYVQVQALTSVAMRNVFYGWRVRHGHQAPMINGGGIFPQSGSGYQSSPSEKDFEARLRNVADLMPEAQSAAQLGNVLFAAWTTQPLTKLTVNGTTPNIRALTLVVQPLTPTRLGPGPFTIRRGVFTPILIGGRQGSNPYGASLAEIGPKGWASFEFHVPIDQSTHFRHLEASINTEGQQPVTAGYAWDWRSAVWVRFPMTSGAAILRRPNRFVSPTGVIRFKVVNVDTRRRYIIIPDMVRDVQISGYGSSD